MEKFIKLQKAKRKRRHGYRNRASSRSGRRILKRRRRIGRKRLSI